MSKIEKGIQGVPAFTFQGFENTLTDEEYDAKPADLFASVGLVKPDEKRKVKAMSRKGFNQHTVQSVLDFFNLDKEKFERVFLWSNVLKYDTESEVIDGLSNGEFAYAVDKRSNRMTLEGMTRVIQYIKRYRVHFVREAGKGGTRSRVSWSGHIARLGIDRNTVDIDGNKTAMLQVSVPIQFFAALESIASESKSGNRNQYVVDALAATMTRASVMDAWNKSDKNPNVKKAGESVTNSKPVTTEQTQPEPTIIVADELQVDDVQGDADIDAWMDANEG